MCCLEPSERRGCPKLLKVRGGIGHPQGDLEGRVTTAELDVAFVVNVYTPNAGAGLKRLDFRTRDWDKAFAEYVRGLETIKPVVVVGERAVQQLSMRPSDCCLGTVLKQDCYLPTSPL